MGNSSSQTLVEERNGNNALISGGKAKPGKVSLQKKEAPVVTEAPKPETKYKFSKKILGEGAYGTVRICVDNQGSEFAAKIINKKGLRNDDLLAIQREVGILAECIHPNIIQFHDYFHNNNNIVIITELVKGGELFDRIVAKKHYSELNARIILSALIDSLCYLHSKNIAHRDIKPENILIFDGPNGEEIVKLADFGFASSNSKLSTECGSRSYMAPEIGAKKYTLACDVWSFGIVMYILIAGYPPFRDENPRRLMEKIRSGKFQYDSHLWETISEECKDLISKVLVVDVSKRLTAAEVKAHPWFTAKESCLSQENLMVKGMSVNLLSYMAAKKKWKKVGRGVMFLNKIKLLKNKDKLSDDAIFAVEGVKESDVKLLEVRDSSAPLA